MDGVSSGDRSAGGCVGWRFCCEFWRSRSGGNGGLLGAVGSVSSMLKIPPNPLRPSDMGDIVEPSKLPRRPCGSKFRAPAIAPAGQVAMLPRAPGIGEWVEVSSKWARCTASSKGAIVPWGSALLLLARTRPEDPPSEQNQL